MAFARGRRLAILGPAVLIWLLAVPLVFHLAGEPERPPVATAVASAASAAPAAPVSRIAETRASRARRPAVAAFVGRDGILVTPGRLARFLRGVGSPMARHADALVAAGVRHRADPRAIVAVAGVESSFGLVMPCYNAWGWGGGRCRWSSWTQAIDAYTGLIARDYPSLARGDFRTAGRSYNPGNWEQWASRARAYFLAI